MTKILALPGGASAGKASKAAAATAGPAGDEPLDDKCGRYLLDILAQKDGKVQRSQLALLASKVALKDPDRLAISKRMADEGFLSTNAAWTYDPASKGQLITA